MSPKVRLALILGVALVCATVVAYAVYRVAVIPRGPLRGRAAFELTLAAVERFDADDADAMVARIEALGARAVVASKDDARIVLRVEEASSAEATASALRPLRLGVHQLVTFPAGTEFPEGVSAPRPELPGARGACEVLQAWACSPGPGCHAGVEHVGEGECAVHCLLDPPVLTRDDVVNAEPGVDDYSNRPILFVTLHADGASRFASFTGAHVGEYLAIAIDDVVASAPRIQSAIPGGRVQITWGDDPADDPAVLARVLTVRGEISPWTLESVR